jgi:hypothetical protein
MLYVDFEAGNKQYKLRLNTRSIIELEKRLGCNPLGILNENALPKIEQLVAVLHASLQQYQHNITMNDAYDIFDAYLEAEENDINKFLFVIIDIYQNAGLIDKSLDIKATTEKN